MKGMKDDGKTMSAVLIGLVAACLGQGEEEQEKRRRGKESRPDTVRVKKRGCEAERGGSEETKTGGKDEGKERLCLQLYY